MKNHVWRPLFVVFGVVALVLAARALYVPADFGVHEQGYMYGFHRLGNEQDWKDQRPEYSFDTDYCAGCHPDKAEAISTSPHAIIPCEDCHGPAGGHPEDPPKLQIDRSRELCMRCHAYLPYRQSGRSRITGIDPVAHNPGMECAGCHDPHHPNMEGT